MQIFKKFNIEAAHRLPHVPPDHKCARLHGHSYHISIYIEGNPDEHSGWIMDLADVKKTFEPIRQMLDHHYLNEIPGLENPTSENLARFIWQKLKPLLPLLSKIVIKETCTSGCVYCGD